MIFDDYKWKMEEYPPERRPQIAIDAFLAIYKNYIDVIHSGWQCIIRKKQYFYWENLKNFSNKSLHLTGAHAASHQGYR